MVQISTRRSFGLKQLLPYAAGAGAAGGGGGGGGAGVAQKANWVRIFWGSRFQAWISLVILLNSVQQMELL